MSIEPVPKEMTDAWEKLARAEAAYCAKFGKDSLDRVLYIEPVNATIEECHVAAKYLCKAIRKNKPLEQIPEEMWDKLIF